MRALSYLGGQLFCDRGVLLLSFALSSSLGSQVLEEQLGHLGGSSQLQTGVDTAALAPFYRQQQSTRCCFVFYLFYENSTIGEFVAQEQLSTLAHHQC